MTSVTVIPKVSNKTHPELQPGEIFYCNATNLYYNQMGHLTTKRKGNKAYDSEGTHRTGMFPVFVQRSEAVEKKLPQLERFG